MRDKLSLPKKKVGGEEERELSRYLRSVVVRKDRHSGMEHQSQTLSVVGNETHAERRAVNIFTTTKDHGTSPRCIITPLWEIA
ncbi:hypothetical protein GFV12_04020 [Desulfurobacterium thermolithotrophum]|uniref:hypothetical protein n=1 Tax=Desulfurobacterium thermolithotrophum TaxID=64160 RepID=UPI003984B651